jgi:hypothetical protein
MRSANYLHIIVIGIILAITSSFAFADELSMEESITLAVIPVKNGNIDQKVYRQFDRLVPELVKIPKKKIVKLEYRYAGQSDRELDVENAYDIAARIAKYLRVRHKLDLDLWLAIDITPKSGKSSSALTVAVFSDEIKKLEAIPVLPPK